MFLLSKSFIRKVLATALTVLTVLLVYQATVIDSRGVEARTPPPAAPGAPLQFEATAYCTGDTTASGVNVQAGIAAGDPKVLPEGSVIQVDGVPERLRGIYTVMDTGPDVRGRSIDVFMSNCGEARDFGRRDIALTVLRLGWNPSNTVPTKR
jgi:3D (Asp-Asp-Asp) domain-containing protein